MLNDKLKYVLIWNLPPAVCCQIFLAAHLLINAIRLHTMDVVAY